LNGARSADDPAYPPDWSGAGDPYHLVKAKLSEVVAPAPSQVFVVMEEHEESIEDGYMRMENPVYGSEIPSENVWWGLPSSRHNLSCNVSFVDGHAESSKWRESKKFKQHGQALGSNLDRQDFQRIETWIATNRLSF
jgi:prepilin-type processing-associated H-X9-DG protein